MKNKQIQTSLTHEIPEWKLKLAYFYAEHKLVIKRFFIFLIFFIDIVVVFVLGTVFINYRTGLISDESQLRWLSLSLVNPQAIEKQQPVALIAGEITAIATNNGKYNLIVTVKNNNKKWTVKELTYTFSVDGQNLESKTTFILPQSEKHLMYFNVDNHDSLELKILNVNWHRIRDYSLLSYKDKIKATKSVYTPNKSGQFSGELEMTIFNDTPYGFWEVGLPIVFYNRNTEPIAIDYIVINKLLSKEERELKINWHERINERVYKIEVYPEINLLNENAIMEIEGPIGPPLGLK